MAEAADCGATEVLFNGATACAILCCFTRSLHANQFPPTDQVQGHASRENAMAAHGRVCPVPCTRYLKLVSCSAPTGPRAWIEDVVVETSTRGQGIGAALVGEALNRAASVGARTVDLTSRPSREAANRLYVRLGFEQRTTNVYRWNYAPDEE